MGGISLAGGNDAMLDALRRAGPAGPGIVARIRADQDELVRVPASTLLVIEGGPGTGKTMTALQRVARLIEDGEVAAAEVLVVGPSAAYARTSRAVLDRMGHREVEHHAIGALMPDVPVSRDEAPHVTRLKGEARMAGLLERALAEHESRRPDKLPRAIAVHGKVVPIDVQALRQVMTTTKASDANPADRRLLLRAVLAVAAEDPRLVPAAADRLAALLWPEPAPAEFLRDLFRSRVRLTTAAGDEFTDREVSALYRTPASGSDADAWSEADLPLLDEIDHALNGTGRTWAHVLVDAAQDLSPMQARAVARRSAAGALTVVGDMAQSTGPWARDDWHDLLAHLPAGTRVHRELRFGYRVPRQIFDLAAELLPTAAPSVQAPTTVRDGPAAPTIRPVEPHERADEVVAAAAEHVSQGRTVAIICPPACRADLEARLVTASAAAGPATPGPAASGVAISGPATSRPATSGSAAEGPGSGAPDLADVALIGPHEARGLEFDAVIVVEPGLIVDDDPRGHRLLYVALTRATGWLHVIGAAEDLPTDPDPGATEISAGDEVATDRAPGSATASLAPEVRESVDMVAHRLVESLLGTLAPELWPVALERVIELITPDE